MTLKEAFARMKINNLLRKHDVDIGQDAHITKNEVARVEEEYIKLCKRDGKTDEQIREAEVKAIETYGKHFDRVAKLGIFKAASQISAMQMSKEMAVTRAMFQTKRKEVRREKKKMGLKPDDPLPF